MAYDICNEKIIQIWGWVDENGQNYGSQIKEICKLLECDPLIDLLPEEFHEALEILVIAEDVVLGQDILEATGWYVALVLQVDKSEVVLHIHALMADFLLAVVDVWVHVGGKGQNFEDQLGCLLLERILSKERCTGTLCSGLRSISSLSCFERGRKIRQN